MSAPCCVFTTRTPTRRSESETVPSVTVNGHLAMLTPALVWTTCTRADKSVVAMEAQQENTHTPYKDTNVCDFMRRDARAASTLMNRPGCRSFGNLSVTQSVSQPSRGAEPGRAEGCTRTRQKINMFSRKSRAGMEFSSRPRRTTHRYTAFSPTGKASEQSPWNSTVHQITQAPLVSVCYNNTRLLKQEIWIKATRDTHTTHSVPQ